MLVIRSQDSKNNNFLYLKLPETQSLENLLVNTRPQDNPWLQARLQEWEAGT